ncbi:DUF2683 family protein [Persicitalea sp.]|uniref:DUF2683 family protein n=1 Tax=Persicitalea sp. TaxID=3100273 RepID=UPI003593DC4C
MTTLTIDTKDQEVLKAVKALLKGFEVPFEVELDSPYDPEFVAKIKKSQQQVKEGKTVKIALDDIWK